MGAMGVLQELLDIFCGCQPSPNTDLSVLSLYELQSLERLRAELATYESCVSPETMLHAPLVSHVQSLCRPESLPTDIRHHGSAADQTGGTLSVYTGASYAPLLVLVTISRCVTLSFCHRSRKSGQISSRMEHHHRASDPARRNILILRAEQLSSGQYGYRQYHWLWCVESTFVSANRE